MTAALATARKDFIAAGYATVDLNGHGPGFESMCPICPKPVTVRPSADGAHVEIECETGCDRDRIVDQLRFRAKRPEWGSGATPATHGDRYAGRVVDLDALLAEPPKPIPWRVHGIVADKTLTVISGESGCGKSWLAQALCIGVSRGEPVAGLECAPGAALYIDSEMGPDMFVDHRLRPAGVTTAPFAYIDAMGLDVTRPDDRAWVQKRILETGADLVVLDSLRRLMPSKNENDSDDMAPAVADLAKMARDTGAAIVLIHHKGDSEKFFRGSSAIKDQADALFGLLRDPDDDDAPRRLTCRGSRAKNPRYAPETLDVFVHVSPEHGGVIGSDPPEKAKGPGIPMREAVAAAIKAAMPVTYKKDAAGKVGRRPDDWAFKGAWEDLERAGEIVQSNGGWIAGGGGLPLDPPTATASVSETY